MNEKDALLLSIALLEKANARLREQLEHGVAPLSPTSRASHVTAWFYGIAAIVAAALYGYWI